MRCLTPTIVAVLALAVATPTAQAFSLSSINSLLSSYGIPVKLPSFQINLPPRAEEAVNTALGSVDSALGELFGEGGVLENIDIPPIDLSDIQIPTVTVPSLPNLPQINLPNLPPISLPSVNIPNVDEILSGVQSRVESRLESVANRIEGIFDDLDLDIDPPSFELPSTVTDLLDDAQGVLDEIIESQAPRVQSVLNSLPLEQLPPAAVQALESVFGSISYQQVAATAAVPEPTSALIATAGLALASAARRRR